jgi:hypothetical protein
MKLMRQILESFRTFTAQEQEQSSAEWQKQINTTSSQLVEREKKLSALHQSKIDDPACKNDSEYNKREEDIKTLESEIVSLKAMDEKLQAGLVIALDKEEQEKLVEPYNALLAEKPEVEKLIASATRETLWTAMLREEDFEAKCHQVNMNLPRSYPPITFKRFDPYGDGRGVALRNIIFEGMSAMDRHDQSIVRLASLGPNTPIKTLEGMRYAKLEEVLERWLRGRSARSAA